MNLPEPSWPLVAVLLMVLAAEFVNGLNDAPNAIATVISTRVLSPIHALIMASALNMLGALLSGTAVALTIGKGIVDPEVIGLPVVGAAVLSVALWGAVATWRGLPISISHGLVAGLAGAAFVTAGFDSLEWSGWQKVIIGLVFSTAVGFSLALIVMRGLFWILRRARPSMVRAVFGRLQIISAGFMAFSHGSNDGQKFMGIFTLAMVLEYARQNGLTPSSDFGVPVWVVFVCGSVMALGTLIGGWRVMKTMGFGLTKLEPVHGFAAETAAASAIQIATSFGIPLSTTHTINTAIMGVGASRRLSAVRWAVGGNIVAAWLLTFPICAVLGAILALLFNLVI
ncbi:MAG: inorganic phosphate transporter [Dehalococcoidia bacterium]|nr:inorganic phosphate transporter [Dehalococcoidia bacterium]